ncbi:MAG: DNA-binding transcriptional regulator Fis [Pseudomonadota bacterium]
MTRVVKKKTKSKPNKRANSSRNKSRVTRPLGPHVKRCMENYFSELNGQAPSQLYDLVLGEIEQPMLEVVMHQTRGNISKAAEYLGLNRATLRKKLEKYGLNA